VDVSAVLIVVELVACETIFALLLLGFAEFPVLAHVLDLTGFVELRVVRLADAGPAFPHGQVLWVDSDSVIFVTAAGAEVCPAAFLLLEIETGGVWEEEVGEEHAGQTEPWHEVELGLRIDVVVENGSEERASLSDCGGETVCGSTDRGGEDLSSDEEGDTVGTKLVEE